MSFLKAGVLADIVKDALTAVLGPFIEEARDAAYDAAHDTIRSAVAGRMSIDEWASAAIKGVDRVKESALNEGGLRFVGGKLRFSYPVSALEDAVTISFQLYFLDEFEKWQVTAAESNVPTGKFTLEALDELSSVREVVFEVE